MAKLFCAFAPLSQSYDCNLKKRRRLSQDSHSGRAVTAVTEKVKLNKKFQF